MTSTNSEKSTTPESATASSDGSADRLTRSIEMMSKIAGIVTPILLAIGGWYFANSGAAKELTFKQFSESSKMTAAISGNDIEKQRDILFSLIEIERPDLLRRSIGYLKASIDTKSDEVQAQTGRDLTTKRISSTEAQERIKQARSDAGRNIENLFRPLLYGALAANDEKVAKIFLETVPEAEKMKRLVWVDEKTGIYEYPLDVAVKSSSLELVELLLKMGAEPYFWTVNSAIDRRDSAILQMVARKLNLDYAITWEVWEHVAKNGSPEQINQLIQVGFPKSGLETAIGDAPLVEQAALAGKPNNLRALALAGAPVIYITEIHPDDLLLVIAENYYKQRWNLFDLRPDRKVFGDVMLEACSIYRSQQIKESYVAESQRYLPESKKSAKHEKQKVIEVVMDAKAWSALACLADYFNIKNTPPDEYLDIFSSALRSDYAYRLLIEKYAFPLSASFADGTPIAATAIKWADVEGLKYLKQRGVNFQSLHRDGRGIYYTLFQNENLPDQSDRVGYVSHIREFADKLSFAVEQTGIEFKDQTGFTPIMYAIKSMSTPLIREVLRYKPNLNQKSVNGETVLSLALTKPKLYAQLYQMGARDPGKVEYCGDVSKATIDEISKLDSMYRPINAEDWELSSTARKSAGECL
jgi:hypothetical protein